MILLYAILLPLAAVQHANEMCHASCYGNRPMSSGGCLSGFCGDGACCKQGLTMPPCDGNMGCNGFQCCTDLAVINAKAAGAGAAGTAAAGTPGASIAPAATPPPLPPLSECGIFRIEYEIGRERHDELGDQEYEVIVRVEPWRPASFVKLVYHQTGLENGVTRPVEVTHLTGGSVEKDTREDFQSLRLQVRTLLLKMSDGLDAELTTCRFGDVSVGAVGQVIAAIGLGTLESSAHQSAVHAQGSTEDGEDSSISVQRVQQAAAAHQCRSGTLRFWTHGSPHKDIRRIGCHLPYDPPPPTPPGRPPPPTPHPPPSEPTPPAFPPLPPMAPQYMFFAAPPPPSAWRSATVVTLVVSGGIISISLVLFLLLPCCTHRLGGAEGFVERAANSAKMGPLGPYGGRRLAAHLAAWLRTGAATAKSARVVCHPHLGQHAPLSSIENNEGEDDDDDEIDEISYLSASRRAARRHSTITSLSTAMDDDDDDNDESHGRCQISARKSGARATAASKGVSAPKVEEWDAEVAAPPAAAAAKVVTASKKAGAEALAAVPPAPYEAMDDDFSLQLFGKPKGYIEPLSSYRAGQSGAHARSSGSVGARAAATRSAVPPSTSNSMDGEIDLDMLLTPSIVGAPWQVVNLHVNLPAPSTACAPPMPLCHGSTRLSNVMDE